MMKETETFENILKYAKLQGKKLYEIAQEEEAQNCEIPIVEIRKKVKKHLDTMKEAIKKGLNSNEISSSKMCGNNCEKLKKHYQKTQSLFNKTYQNILLYAIATAEENARMGKIAACPTAGSCGIVPSVIIAFAQEKNISEEKEINALITAGIIGQIISNKVALAGAVMGCQGECGVAAAMAAAALVEIFNGTNEQIINGAILTLKNIMGLICDPVGGLVEIPCVKRNAFLATYAVTGAELALGGIESFIPADEIVDAVKQVGILMSPQLKESSQAGLATTKTGQEISEFLFKK